MMLAFQNLHQFVFNLSQVTSAVSSCSVRVSSASVKQQPKKDEICAENLLLKICKEYENTQLFENLPNLKFGPKFEDIQWIYFSDASQISKNSVKSKELYTSPSSKKLHNFSANITNFNVSPLRSKKYFRQQLQLLTTFESSLQKGSAWNVSFVSKNNFSQNKNSSYCGRNEKFNFYKTSPLFSTLVKNSNIPNFNKVHSRGFKTKRAIESEGKSNNWFSSKYEKMTVSQDEKTIENKSNKYLEMVADESLSPEDKLKLKVSFAEGYMVANNELRKSGATNSVYSKILTLAKNIILGFVLGLALISLVPGGKTLFPFTLGRHGEINPEEVGVTFSDVKGVEEVKEELQEIVEFLRNPSKFSNMGGKLPRGVLLVGPPGTGKTLLARAVAGEANVPFFHASGSEFDEIFVGEGARRVRNLFNSAKAKAPAIIFIDEIDCVGAKRKSTMLHPYANQTINQLLSEMDGFSKTEGVIVLGATNRKSDLDSALLRPGRFDVEVLVPLPDFEGRKEILELYVSKILSKDIDVEKIAKATAGCTGADLEAMVNHAAIRAASEGASYVTMAHIENAKDKVMIGPERKSASQSDEANLITAYHEGGHTIVAYFTEGVGLVDKVTIIPRGESLGHTAVVPENDEKYITKAMCLARMDICLGGRAAEELIFGVNKITANASDDLDKATALASRMVKNFGMSEKIGLRTLRSAEGELVSTNHYGQTVSDQIDVEVKKLIQESYERAKSILKKHAKEHKILAEALLKYKTLHPEDVKAILGDNSAEKGYSSTSAGSVASSIN